MKALLLALVATSTGCFTSWATTQAFGTQRILDEGGRDEVVPQPGVRENLSVTLPLAIEYARPPATTTTTASPAPPSPREPLPFELACTTSQQARDRVYHSAFRYGSRWKKTAGIAFLLEAAAATGFLLLDRNRDAEHADDRSGLLAGGFLALDAIGTAVIFFIPRKEVFTVEDRPVTTQVRTDCPAGLVLEIAGTTFPVDAAGRIGELGEVALDEWMQAPAGSVALALDGRALPLRLEQREQCAWLRSHHPELPDACGAHAMLPRRSTAILSVPVGTLTTAGADESEARRSRDPAGSAR